MSELPPRRSRLPRDLGPRVAVAVPAVAVLVLVNHLGGVAFALPLAVLGLIGVWELARLRPMTGWAIFAAGVAWLTLCLVHAVLLRELPHGAGLVVDVLLAVFIGDTAAQLFGSAFGRRRLAPSISPNKTVEGLLAGIVVGTAACWAFATFAQDFLSSLDALLLGLACALAAPAGDLLESAVKRRAGVKDSGTLFGPHGGVLDRVDAAICAALVGYYVVRAVS